MSTWSGYGIRRPLALWLYGQMALLKLCMVKLVGSQRGTKRGGGAAVVGEGGIGCAAASTVRER